MEKFLMGTYDVIVVGAGHAGCEAGLAAARMGQKTLMLSINLEAVAMMACNPSIGGTGKGHLVREIDALGGEMGINIDKTFIQSRMLNTAKGPAVHSLRAQADKNEYHIEMKKTIEKEENLHLKQGEVIGSDRRGWKGVRSRAENRFVLQGESCHPRYGNFPCRKDIHRRQRISTAGLMVWRHRWSWLQGLREYGLPMRRFKTGHACQSSWHRVWTSTR